MSSSTIHWFPGHMATARSEIRKAMPGVDLVIEVLDARIPFSSENPLVAELRGTKPCIQILNKADLADPAVTAEWLAIKAATPGIHPLVHNHKQGSLLRTVTAIIKTVVPPRPRPVAAIIVGIPNVGKCMPLEASLRARSARSGSSARTMPSVSGRAERLRGVEVGGPDGAGARGKRRAAGLRDIVEDGHAEVGEGAGLAEEVDGDHGARARGGGERGGVEKGEVVPHVRDDGG